jgi:hypothetical protein
MATFTARTHVIGGQSAFARALTEAIKPRMTRAGDLMAKDAKARVIAAAPVGKNSGKRSTPLSSPSAYRTTITPTPTGFQLDFTVRGSSAFMAKFHATNTGSAPHEQRGNARGFTRFEETDDVIRRPFVHPGTTGTRWYDNAIEDTLDHLNSYLL